MNDYVHFDTILSTTLDHISSEIGRMLDNGSYIHL